MNEALPIENKFISVFRNIKPESYTGTATTTTEVMPYSFLNIKTIVASLIFGTVITCCILGYIYRDWVFAKTGYYTLQLYLGKPNEIRKTEIPQNSRLRTLYEDFEIMEQLRL